MSFLTIVLILFIIIGFGLIIFSFFNRSEGISSNMEIQNYENIIEAINSSIGSADDSMEELNKMSESIFKELEGKYQEFLFLYQMLDEKQKEIAEKRIDLQVDSEIPKKEIQDPRLKKILKLKKEGLSYSEIAKKLDMGQGEVKLMAELGKAR